jgi:peptidoglycan/xylan/chitin deacetylase (PgdA/CDA1 family)
MTLTRAELRPLLDAGVDLQNHGWSHSHHANLTPTESAREVREGREWFRRELGIDTPWFAVPFGDSRPHDIGVDCEVWLALNDAWPAGWLSPSVFNRRALTLPVAGPRASRAAWSLRSLSDRISGLLRP